MEYTFKIRYIPLAYILLLGLVFSGCRKDKSYGTPLVGEKAFLVGEWELRLTEHTDRTGGTPIVTYTTPEETNTDYRIFFYEDGYTEFFEDGKLVRNTYITILEGFEIKKTGSLLDPMKVGFSFYMDGDDSYRVGVNGYLDSLRCEYFPRANRPWHPDHSYMDYVYKVE